MRVALATFLAYEAKCVTQVAMGIGRQTQMGVATIGRAKGASSIQILSDLTTFISVARSYPIPTKPPSPTSLWHSIRTRGSTLPIARDL